MASVSMLRREADGLGGVLRSIRAERKLTLADVSRMSGIALSTLAKMEKGQSPFSYDRLVRLTRGLEIDITTLFEGVPAGGAAARKAEAGTGRRRSITRAGGGHDIRTASYDYTYPAVDLLHKALTPMIVEARHRTIEEFGDLVRHPGEEFAVVMEGAIAFHTDSYAPELLRVGDSVYFDSGMGHAYLAAAPGRCVLLSVCSAASSDLDVHRPALVAALDEP